MKWLVGLDLARSSAGAIRFAKWVHDRTDDVVMGLHAMEVPSAAMPEWTDVVAQRIRGLLDDMLKQQGYPDLFVDVAQSNDAHKSLAETREKAGCDAIVIGRHAKTEQIALIRLGRVARKSVRYANAPLIVCPPEVDMDALDGPIILATDATERTGATQFARQVAKEWKRPWIACHVATAVDDYASAYFLNAETLRGAQKALRDSGQRLLTAWNERLEEKPSEALLLQGELDQELLKLASERKACMIVVGSRRLSTAERLFSSTPGKALAAYAGCPVAIVPSPAEGEDAEA